MNGNQALTSKIVGILQHQMFVKHNLEALIVSENNWVLKNLGQMAKYPELKHSMKSVRKAGKLLSDRLHLSDPDVHEIFQVANSWRDSHIYPMRSIYLTLRHRVRRNGHISGDMASRAKRMASIRRKLRDSNVNVKLDQMNDIAGCRAILDDMSQVNRLRASILNNFPHDLRQEWPYIDDPKKDGYRSHHIVFNFSPKSVEQEVFAGRRIELQIRTRLQHSWATAIEAVSLYKGDDLKHHQGDAKWLRLFSLVSAEFAETEGCSSILDVPDHQQRLSEIRSLAEEIEAIPFLRKINVATNYAENFLHDRGKYFLIIYKPDHTVDVENYSYAMQFNSRLAALEKESADGGGATNVVLVEVDKVENLIKSYPNYFGDVSLFTNNLERICTGKEPIEYTLAPQEIIAPKQPDRIDPKWMLRNQLGNRHYSKK